MIQKTNRNILENILLNIFKCYILKYIIKFLQIIINRDNNKKKNSAFIISRNTCKKLAEHRLRTSAVDLSLQIGKVTLAHAKTLEALNFQCSNFQCDRDLKLCEQFDPSTISFYEIASLNIEFSSKFSV